MSIKAVIFDLDGTITEPYLDFDQIRREIGVDPDAGPLLELMKAMPPARRQRAEQIMHKHEQRAVRESTLNEGAGQTIRRLRQAGMKIGILTRNTRDNASAVLTKHNLHYDAVVGRGDGPVKPDSYGVEYLCELFGVECSEALLVGDYLFDILSAASAGAVSVLLLNQQQSQEFVDEADFVIDRLEEIFEIIHKVDKPN